MNRVSGLTHHDLTAFESRFEVCKGICNSTALISKRLYEAGVQRDSQGKYMMTPIQAAVALDRPSMVQALLHHDASMPVVLVRHDNEAMRDAEDVARTLRVRDSFGIGVLP